MDDVDALHTQSCRPALGKNDIKRCKVIIIDCYKLLNINHTSKKSKKNREKTHGSDVLDDEFKRMPSLSFHLLLCVFFRFAFI